MVVKSQECFLPVLAAIGAAIAAGIPAYYGTKNQQNASKPKQN